MEDSEISIFVGNIVPARRLDWENEPVTLADWTDEDCATDVTDVPMDEETSLLVSGREVDGPQGTPVEVLNTLMQFLSRHEVRVCHMVNLDLCNVVDATRRAYAQPLWHTAMVVDDTFLHVIDFLEASESLSLQVCAPCMQDIVMPHRDWLHVERALHTEILAHNMAEFDMIMLEQHVVQIDAEAEAHLQAMFEFEEQV